MKTKRTMKSIAAAALALTLVAAPASEGFVNLFDGTSVGINASAATAMVNVDELVTAIGNAASGDTITVKTPLSAKELELSATLTIAQDVTINLNGLTLKPAATLTDEMINVTATGDVTIDGGVIENNRTSALDKNVIKSAATADLVIKNTTIKSNAGTEAAVAPLGGLTLEKVTVEAAGNATAVKVADAKSATIKGGSIIAKKLAVETNGGTVTLDEGVKVSSADGKPISATASAAANTSLNITKAEVDGTIIVGGTSTSTKTSTIAIGAGANLKNFKLSQDATADEDHISGSANGGLGTVTVAAGAKISLDPTYAPDMSDSSLADGFAAASPKLGIGADGTVMSVATANQSILTEAKTIAEAYIASDDCVVSNGTTNSTLQTAIQAKVRQAPASPVGAVSRLAGVTVTASAFTGAVAADNEKTGSFTTTITIVAPDGSDSVSIADKTFTIPKLLTDTEQYNAIKKDIDDKVKAYGKNGNILNAVSTTVISSTDVTAINNKYDKVKIHGSPVTGTVTNATATDSGKVAFTVVIDTSDGAGDWIEDSADDVTYELTIKSSNERLNDVKESVETLVNAAMDAVEADPSSANVTAVNTKLATDIGNVLIAADNGVSLDATHKTIVYTAAVTTPGSEAPAKVKADVIIKVASDPAAANITFDTEREVEDVSEKLDAAAAAVEVALESVEVTNDTKNEDVQAVVDEALKSVVGSRGIAAVNIQTVATDEADGVATIAVSVVVGASSKPVAVVKTIPALKADVKKATDAKPMVDAYLSALTVTKDTKSEDVTAQLKKDVALPEGVDVAVTVTLAEDGKNATVSAVITSGAETVSVDAKPKDIATAGSTGVDGDVNGDGEVNALDIRYLLKKLGY